jgi:CRISPR/Cas system CSM-associated protein Csm3 (group 7 of RAMP superfamily)
MSPLIHQSYQQSAVNSVTNVRRATGRETPAPKKTDMPTSDPSKRLVYLPGSALIKAG